MEERAERIHILEEAAGPLLQWFRENRRELPFRASRDPYHIYVSEIMLQQTRISTVIPYFLRFIDKYPDLNALSRAEEPELLKLWEGLGYYSRVRNMKKTAEICAERYGGALPRTYGEISALPGIGSYTAGAVLSLAFDERVPLVDGNVLRVLSRFFGDSRDVGEPGTKKSAEDLLRAFLEASSVSPAAFNEALMELGETLCIPKGKPDCGACPLKDGCRALREGRTGELPVKAPRQKRQILKLTVFLLYAEGKLGIVKRDDNGLLAGLYGLPLTEDSLEPSEAEEFLRAQGAKLFSVKALPPAVHVFTHREWRMTAYEASLSGELRDFSGVPLLFVPEEELIRKYALPGAFRKWELFPDSEEP